MELLEAINGRRSVREYTDEVVNDTILRELIGLAVQAPSAVNQQPWSFVVIKDRALMTHISDRAKVHMQEPARRVVVTLSRHAERPEFPDFLSRARADRNLRGGRRRLGGRGLRAGRRESDARSLRRRPRNLLDRLRTKLAHHPRRQVGPRAATRLYPRGAHYSRPPTSSTRVCPAQSTRHSLARSLSTQIPTYAYRRLKPPARHHAA
jgi:nitroreductase